MHVFVPCARLGGLELRETHLDLPPECWGSCATQPGLICSQWPVCHCAGDFPLSLPALSMYFWSIIMYSFWCFWNRFSLCSLAWPGTPFIYLESLWPSCLCLPSKIRYAPLLSELCFYLNKSPLLSSVPFWLLACFFSSQVDSRSHGYCHSLTYLCTWFLGTSFMYVCM